ncbi:MAG TPA: hypothetical protein VKA68_07545 [bacterium]|nr:hypothetical protein [bacterium]
MSTAVSTADSAVGIGFVVLGVIGTIGLLLCILPVQYVFRWQREQQDADMDISFRVRILRGVFAVHMQRVGGDSSFYYSFFTLRRHFEPGKTTEPDGEPEQEESPVKPSRKIRSLRRISAKTQRVFNFLSFRDIWKLARLLLHHLWTWLRPDLFRTELTIGTGDPMSTGLLFGVLRGSGLDQNIDGSIEPNFTDAAVLGDLRVAGTLRIGGGLWRGVHVLLYAIFLVISKKIDKLLAH